MRIREAGNRGGAKKSRGRGIRVSVARGIGFLAILFLGVGEFQRGGISTAMPCAMPCRFEGATPRVVLPPNVTPERGNGVPAPSPGPGGLPPAGVNRIELREPSPFLLVTQKMHWLEPTEV